MTNPQNHLFWITSRAAGVTALVLSSVTVAFGLLMGGKLLKGGGADRRAVHEILSLSVMVAIAVHGFSLLGDSFLRPTVADLTVPFVFSYKTLSTSIGIVAGWGLVALGLSYYLRRRIGAKRWAKIHRFTLLVWVLGLLHALTEGTDAGQRWFLALVLITAAPAIVLLPIRVIGARAGSARARALTPARGAGGPRVGPQPSPMLRARG